MKGLVVAVVMGLRWVGVMGVMGTAGWVVVVMGVGLVVVGVTVVG